MAAFQPSENQLKFEDKNDILQDYQYSNKATICYFLYLLTGIDKLHDFGDSQTGFKKIYDLILVNHFSNTTVGKKIIGTGELVETDLRNKVQALHKMIDFMSYAKKTYNSPILNAPLLTFQTFISSAGDIKLDYIAQAPAAILPVNITSLAGTDPAQKAALANYIAQIPPTRDVILYFTGRAKEFGETDSITALREILSINEPEYISKDAFPMDGKILSKMLGHNAEKLEFQCYTSQLMDPATQAKKTLPVTKTIKSFYCNLTGNKKLLLTAEVKSEKVKLSFELQPAAGALAAGAGSFEIDKTTPTPSIMDVIIYMYWVQASSATAAAKPKVLKQNFGAKIVNMFKKDQKKQNVIAANLNTNYFSKLFAAIPDAAKVILDDKQLISVATKTIGDQTYLWDALINDSRFRSHNIHGSFVTTVDSFLFDQIVHGKNANAIFASKSNGTMFEKAQALALGSNYQMAIYLKPLLGVDADKFKAAFALRQQVMIDELITVTETLTVKKGQVDELIEKFKTKQTNIVGWLVEIFTNINAKGEGAADRIPRIPSVYSIPGSRPVSVLEHNVSISAQDVSNLYYSACYLLQFIVQCLISLKEVKDFDLAAHAGANIENVNIINSMIGRYDDANQYYEDSLKEITHNYYDSGADPQVLERGLYEYLAEKDPVNTNTKGDKTDLGYIIPRMGQKPDFESIRNSLNMNKFRLDSKLETSLPTTIGFSRCFHYIKPNVINYFAAYQPNLRMDGGATGQMIGGETVNVTEAEFKMDIITVFPKAADITREASDTAVITTGRDASALDNYEMLFLLKQLFYEKNEEDEFLEEVDSEERRAVLGLSGGGKKSVDDYYETVYELSVESGLWDNIQDFIEPQSMVNSRKLKAIRAQKAKEQPQMDLSKLRMKTGLGPNVQPLVPDNGGQWSEPVGVFGGKRGTKTMKSRKPSTTITKKRRYVTKTARRKKTKNANRSKKNKTRRKRHY